MFCFLTSRVQITKSDAIFRFVFFSRCFFSSLDVIVRNLMSTMSLSRIYCISDWSDLFFFHPMTLHSKFQNKNGKKTTRKKSTGGERWREKELESQRLSFIMWQVALSLIIESMIWIYYIHAYKYERRE